MARPLRTSYPGAFYHVIARGNGGQKIYVFPKLDLVAVFTDSHYSKAIGHRQPHEFFNEYIVPAITNPK